TISRFRRQMANLDDVRHAAPLVPRRPSGLLSQRQQDDRRRYRVTRGLRRRRPPPALRAELLLGSQYSDVQLSCSPEWPALSNVERKRRTASTDRIADDPELGRRGQAPHPHWNEASPSLRPIDCQNGVPKHPRPRNQKAFHFFEVAKFPDIQVEEISSRR